MRHCLRADPYATGREITRDVAECGITYHPPIFTDPGAIHAGTAHDAHAPAAIGSSPKHGEGVVADEVPDRPAAALDLAADATVVEREVGTGEAVDADLGDGAEVGVDPKVLACRPDRGSDGVEGAGPPQPGMARVLDPGGAEDTTTPIEQGHVRLGIPAVDREDRGPHGACSLIHGS